jgi:hypothetical protein
MSARIEAFGSWGKRTNPRLEFKQEPNGEWKQKRHGKPSASFFESLTSSKKMSVHSDPFEFLILSGSGKGVLTQKGLKCFCDV